LVNVLKSSHSGLKRWSQLSLDSASATIQYNESTVTDTKEDIVDTDLNSGFGGSRSWQGEVDAIGDITSGQGVWFIRDTANTNDGGSIVWGFSTNLNSGTSLTATFDSGTWLGAHTLTSLQTYFETNTYTEGTRYYYYDTDLTEVRRFLRTATDTWSDLGATEFDDVSNTELTRDTSALLSQGRLSVALSTDAIEENKDDTFRVKVDLVEGSNTFVVYLPIDLEDMSFSLSDIVTPQTADAETFTAGATERFIDLEDWDGIDSGTWENYDITSVSVVVQHSSDSGGTWTDIGVTGFEGLLPTEYTLNTTEALTAHRFGFRIHNGAIDADIEHDAVNRLRFLVTIEDNNMAMIERSIPFSAESRISLSSFPATTNATARTVREGGTADSVSLTSLLSLITDWDDIHWDSAAAVIQQSTDEGATWATQTAEFEGLAISERTLTTDDLLANGNFSLSLGEDTLDADILHDSEDRLRVYVTLVSGDITRYVSIPYSFRAPNSLSDLTSFLTSAAQIFREGSAAATLEYTTLFSDITDIDDYNIHTATLIVQYSDDSGVNWHPMGSLGFQGLLPSEYTLTTTNLATMLEWMFNIHNNVIDTAILHDAEDRLRFLLTIEGD
jgi:hypothetical protein